MDNAAGVVPSFENPGGSKGRHMREIVNDFSEARIEMFESGLFGQGAAFWRWVATDAAAPYLAGFAADRRAPFPGEPFVFDPSAEDLLAPDRLAQLAAEIEAAHG
jgi:hypothetical protein